MEFTTTTVAQQEMLKGIAAEKKKGKMNTKP